MKENKETWEDYVMKACAYLILILIGVGIGSSIATYSISSELSAKEVELTQLKIKKLKMECGNENNK